MSSAAPSPAPSVGIVVLNYHHPLETLACVRSLLKAEAPSTRILWVENDAARTGDAAERTLRESGLPFQRIDPDHPDLPPGGTLGLVLNSENLGYAGGNNVGLQVLARMGVPFAWVLNNDTQLACGSSALLVSAAEARPEVAFWGTTILAEHTRPVPRTVRYMGGKIRLRDFSTAFVEGPLELEEDPLAYVSGCSLFGRTETFASLGFIPHDYFLYYEDPALSFEARKQGRPVSGVEGVEILHHESLSTGRRSPLMEFYNRRNRWMFIQRYFPEHLTRQRWRMGYILQKLLLRFRFDRIRLELWAYADFRAGRSGRTDRDLSRMPEV